MASFDEQLAAAKAAPRSSLAIEVSLDAEVSAELEGMDKEIERLIAEGAIDRRLSGENPAIQKARDGRKKTAEAAAAKLTMLKFYRVPGLEWSTLAAQNPARPGVNIDEKYGYNFHAVVEAVLPSCGRRIDGDSEVAMASEQWADIMSVLSGYDAGRVVDVIFYLNEWEPSQAVDRIKKGFTSAPAYDQRLTQQ